MFFIGIALYERRASLDFTKTFHFYRFKISKFCILLFFFLETFFYQTYKNFNDYQNLLYLSQNFSIKHLPCSFTSHSGKTINKHKTNTTFTNTLFNLASQMQHTFSIDFIYISLLGLRR